MFRLSSAVDQFQGLCSCRVCLVRNNFIVGHFRVKYGVRRFRRGRFWTFFGEAWSRDRGRGVRREHPCKTTPVDKLQVHFVCRAAGSMLKSGKFTINAHGVKLRSIFPPSSKVWFWSIQFVLGVFLDRSDAAGGPIVLCFEHILVSRSSRHVLNACVRSTGGGGACMIACQCDCSAWSAVDHVGSLLEGLRNVGALLEGFRNGFFRLLNRSSGPRAGLPGLVLAVKPARTDPHPVPTCVFRTL